eukprot:1895569-Amphidinium_carterae.1
MSGDLLSILGTEGWVTEPWKVLDCVGADAHSISIHLQCLALLDQFCSPSWRVSRHVARHISQRHGPTWFVTKSFHGSLKVFPLGQFYGSKQYTQSKFDACAVFLVIHVANFGNLKSMLQTARLQRGFRVGETSKGHDCSSIVDR